MIEDQLQSRDIVDSGVIEVMQSVTRELFVLPNDRERAYFDGPLEIGFGQTISQPYIVASMTQALHLNITSRVLEIGTGSGYQTMVLAQLAKAVFTIELIPELAARSEELLRHLGILNVNFRVGDGRLGWPEYGPFDAILSAAAADSIPDAWIGQLALGGRLVCPVAVEGGRQELRMVHKTATGIETRTLYEVRFVPLR
jgi:protein-L-isoaspartate(D-aspartate) O-methyltransferase